MGVICTNMALSKRNSRQIAVDELVFRWSTSQDSGYMVLVVQHDSGNGAKLEVIISDDKNIIIENGSYVFDAVEFNRLVITPSMVEQVIRDSISLGWSPTKNGKTVELSMNNNKLEVRRGI